MSLSRRLGSDSELQRAGSGAVVASSIAHSSTVLFSEFAEKLANPESAVLFSWVGKLNMSIRAQSGGV